jgi:hypothetical protein
MSTVSLSSAKGRSDMHVLIAGASIGGLCLAQGLRA